MIDIFSKQHIAVQEFLTTLEEVAAGPAPITISTVPAPYAPTPSGVEAAIAYEEKPIGKITPAGEPEPLVDIPPLIPFAFPEATYEESLDILAELQRLKEISPLAAFVAPGAGIEQLFEITTEIGLAQGTGPPISPPGGLPGIPDIFGGIKEAGKWLLIGGAAIAGVVLLSSLLKGGRR